MKTWRGGEGAEIRRMVSVLGCKAEAIPVQLLQEHQKVRKERHAQGSSQSAVP